jgi:hypothetical protein
MLPIRHSELFEFRIMQLQLALANCLYYQKDLGFSPIVL